MSVTILLNFSHPLSVAQLADVVAWAGAEPQLREIMVEIDRARPIAEIAAALVDTAGLSPAEWQTESLLINPPGLAPLALALIAEIHGRCGYFPTILNVRPIAGATPPRFEVGEIVDLQAVRESARRQRHPMNTWQEHKHD